MTTRRTWYGLAGLVLPVLMSCSDSSDDGSGTGNAGTGNASTGGGAPSGGGASGPAGGTDNGAGGSSASGTASGTGAGSGTGTGGASTTGGGRLCDSLGWCQILNTKLADVCPDPAQYPEIQANEGCSGVINDWNGGIADQTRDRLIVWGGGHGGYFGNEVYALDLSTLTMNRLNEPSDVAGVDFNDCYVPDAYPDGRPNSRHTYDTLAYIAHADQMFAHSGAKAPCGYSNNDTWLLDLATVDSAPSGQAAPWARVYPSGDGTLAWPGQPSDYDPVSKLVFLNDIYQFWSYDHDANAYTLLNPDAFIDYHLTGRVDPKRHLFIMMGAAGAEGGGVIVFDIGPGSDHQKQDWTSQVSGCDGLINAIYPGLAYDPVQDKMVGWAGGDTLYLFDPDTKSCTTVEWTGGPGPQNPNGTMGRFRYLESLNVFVVVNDWQQDGYTLRLTPP
jgi:hypothetical protein